MVSVLVWAGERLALAPVMVELIFALLPRVDSESYAGGSSEGSRIGHLKASARTDAVAEYIVGLDLEGQAADGLQLRTRFCSTKTEIDSSCCGVSKIISQRRTEERLEMWKQASVNMVSAMF